MKKVLSTSDVCHYFANKLQDEGRNSWLEYRTNFDDRILELKGLRLRTWIINNFGYKLFSPKYIKHLKENTKRINHRRVKVTEYKNGNISNVYRSAINTQTDCNLTGFCYDDSLLKPFYDFIAYKDPQNMQYVTLEDLLDDSYHNLKKDLESEEEYLNSEESKSEYFEENDMYFDITGKLL